MNTVSFVFQNSRLIKASILENVRMGRPEATREEVMRASKRRSADIIAKLPDGIDTVIGTNGVYLSGGEQQRIAIARAMLKNAPFMILDEATAFADPDNEARVQAALSSSPKGKTVIMIAHRLSYSSRRGPHLRDERRADSRERHQSPSCCAQGGISQRMWQNYQTLRNGK